MFQKRCFIDYGKGSKPATTDDNYYSEFYLDMVSIVGLPLEVLTQRVTTTTDVVHFTFQRWNAPYGSKHAISNMDFGLEGRTFRLGSGGSREIWFIVMHPAASIIVQDPEAERRRKARPKHNTAMRYKHAEALAEYIKEIFYRGELVGEGVEKLWRLGSKVSKTIQLGKWYIFQREFVRHWPDFVNSHSHYMDDFWVDNKPAFHTYDHGANIEIKIEEPLGKFLEKANASQLGIHLQGRVGNGWPEGGCDSSSEAEAQELSDTGGEFEDESQDLPTIQSLPGTSMARPSLPSPPTLAPTSTPDENPINLFEALELCSDGVKNLIVELEKKYRISAVSHFSYALAANIFCTSADKTKPRCLLANRPRMARQYDSEKDFDFFPLGFNFENGNFSSPGPPRFLSDFIAITQNHMCNINDGTNPASFGFFQGYSNIKRAIRSTPGELLATKGIATAALTLPRGESASLPRVRTKQDALLRQLRGENTPSCPSASIPFAREEQQIDMAIKQGEYQFRMEQVVHVEVAKLEPELMSFTTVLIPMFYLIKFFLTRKVDYIVGLQAFKPSSFPGVLISFAQIFKHTFKAMDDMFKGAGISGLTLAQCEFLAVVDRLGHFCFTGDKRVLPRKLFTALGTMGSLEKCAWPFIDPKVLRVDATHDFIAMYKWPDDDGHARLAHIASLAYHYTQAVAARRQGQLWFGVIHKGQLGSMCYVGEVLTRVVRDLWRPQVIAFVITQLRRALNVGVRAGSGLALDTTAIRQDAHAALEKWAHSEMAFTWQ